MAIKSGRGTNVVSLVDLACSPQTSLTSFDEVKHQILAFVANEQTKDVRVIVDQIKKLLN